MLFAPVAPYWHGCALEMICNIVLNTILDGSLAAGQDRGFVITWTPPTHLLLAFQAPKAGSRDIFTSRPVAGVIVESLPLTFRFCILSAGNLAALKSVASGPPGLVSDSVKGCWQNKTVPK